MTRILWIAAFVFALAATPAGAEPAPQKRIVVELFTSQGCSSCPPADAYLRELAKRSDLLVLSLHVDYWNYIGWKDPFSSRQMTDRQNGYKKAFQLRFIYTPQMVVDGRAEVVGSRADLAERILAEAKARDRVPIAISRYREGAATVRIAAASFSGDPAIVWLVFYDDEHTTSIERGENEGRTIVNANVVRIWRKLGTWTGEEAEYRVAASEHGAAERDNCAVILQRGYNGPILGAAAGPLKMPVK
ncbi:MAG: DUF1223 domain-containing protein [Rhodospirillaceae bacterium]